MYNRADTRYMGCGTTKCYDGSQYYRYYLVCNFWRGGNYAGEYPYTSGMCRYLSILVNGSNLFV